MGCMQENEGTSVHVVALDFSHDQFHIKRVMVDFMAMFFRYFVDAENTDILHLIARPVIDLTRTPKEFTSY